MIYKTIFVPFICNDRDFRYARTLNSISADVWNYCVRIDKENNQKLTLSQLEFMTKNKFLLHAKGIHHIVFKYYYARNAMWKSRKAKHDNSSTVELPYREKKYLPTGWDSQAIHPEYENNKIRLTVLKGRHQIICDVKSIPQNIVEIELVYKDKYYLAIKYKEEENNDMVKSKNIASIDLGEIHAITSIDNNGNCIIITNRKIRSLVRLKDKRQGELQSLRSNCQIESNKATIYTKALYDIKFSYDRKILDVLHKQTTAYLNWCLKNDISKVYYGDVDGTTRDSRGRLSQKTNHKLNMWRFGVLTQQLKDKLYRHGIEMVKINEAYSSQTCPSCGKLNKPNSRNYVCKSCGYEQHRDVVGAINILNFNSDEKIKNYTNKVYLQID